MQTTKTLFETLEKVSHLHDHKGGRMTVTAAMEVVGRKAVSVSAIQTAPLLLTVAIPDKQQTR